MERGAGDRRRQAPVGDELELSDANLPAELRVSDDHQRLPPQMEPEQPWINLIRTHEGYFQTDENKLKSRRSAEKEHSINSARSSTRSKSLWPFAT